MEAQTPVDDFRRITGQRSVASAKDGADCVEDPVSGASRLHEVRDHESRTMEGGTRTCSVSAPVDRAFGGSGRRPPVAPSDYATTWRVELGACERSADWVMTIGCRFGVVGSPSTSTAVRTTNPTARPSAQTIRPIRLHSARKPDRITANHLPVEAAPFSHPVPVSIDEVAVARSTAKPLVFRAPTSGYPHARKWVTESARPVNHLFILLHSKRINRE